MPAMRRGRMAVVAAATSRPGAMPAPKRISVLGATGSVGTSTLDLIGRTPLLFEVVALTAQSNVEALAECALRHRAALAVIADPSRYNALKERLAGSGIEVAAGAEALIEAAERPADCVMAGIIGAAGLRPDHGGRAAGAPRGACQQGMPGHGGRGVHGGRAPGRHRAGAGRFGAFGGIPGARRGRAGGLRAHHPDRLGWAFPHLEPRAAGAGHARGGAAPSQLVDGTQDHH